MKKYAILNDSNEVLEVINSPAPPPKRYLVVNLEESRAHVLMVVDDEIQIDEQKLAEANVAELTLKTAQAWANLRSERNKKLSECDYTQLPDAGLTAQKKKEWSTYRESLRNLPQNISNPLNFKWPKKPL